MRAKKPVSYGELHFETQTEARAYLKAMLHQYDVGDRASASDAAILTAALALHLEGKEKIGSGIKNFSIRIADFASKCFWVNRTDVTTEKFSYKVCG